MTDFDPHVGHDGHGEPLTGWRRFVTDWRLWASLAIALLMVCVTVAFSSVVLDRGATRKQLDAATAELRDTRSDLADAKKAVGISTRATDCRTRLANAVADKQAEAIVAIGDLALSLYQRDPVAARKAADRYRLASASYRFAVAARGDSVAKCKGS